MVTLEANVIRTPVQQLHKTEVKKNTKQIPILQLEH